MLTSANILLYFYMFVKQKLTMFNNFIQNIIFYSLCGGVESKKGSASGSGAAKK